MLTDQMTPTASQFQQIYGAQIPIGITNITPHIQKAVSNKCDNSEKAKK